MVEGEEKLGELAGLARLEVEFWNKFSNVLHITTKLVLLQKDKTTTVNIEYDRKFIVSYNLMGILAYGQRVKGLVSLSLL